MIFAASFAVAQWGSVAQPAAAFFLLPMRGWELLIGAFAAFYLSRVNRRPFGTGLAEAGGWIGVALILGAVFGYSHTTPFPGVYALAPTIGTLCIILFATEHTTVGKCIGNRAFVGIGLISYSAYLWHQPLFAFARHRSLTEPGELVFVVLSIVSLVLAYVSWRYVEAPFRNKAKFTQKEIFVFSIIGSLFFIAFGLAGHFSDGFQARLSSEIRAVANTKKMHVGLRDDGGCNLWKKQFEPNFCVKGDTDVAPRYLLIGDSHAASIAPALSERFKQDNKSFIQVTKNACPLGDDIQESNLVHCDKFNSAALSFASQSPINTYILFARWSWYIHDKEFDNTEGGIERARSSVYTAGQVPLDAPSEARKKEILKAYITYVSRLIDAGKTVFLIYPTPEQGWDVPSLATKKLLGLNKDVSFGIKESVYLARNHDVISAFDGLGDHANLIRIRPAEIFCNTLISGRCVAYHGGTPFYYDDDHISNNGAKLLIDRIAALLP